MEISYEDNYVRNRYVNPGSEFQTHVLSERKIIGIGDDFIEKGNKSNSIVIKSRFEKNDVNVTSEGQTTNPQLACSDLTVDNQINFSIRLSDDCKHWIFSYSPI